MARYLDVAVKLAREAGRLQMEHLEDAHTIEHKEGIQLVTEVDKACESLIVDGLRQHFPEHDVFAEEGTGERKESEFMWIIDPLDGTTNYAHQFPFFGVSIGLQRKGEVIAGATYDPNRDELFEAELGKGARLNGNRISVSGNAQLQNALLATGFAYVDRSRGHLDNMDYFEAFVRDARAVRRPGAATIDLAYVACGRLDGFWELNLKPWDMAAGLLIIREAGGKVTGFDGGDFDLFGNQMLASNGIIHEQMSEVLAKR